MILHPFKERPKKWNILYKKRQWTNCDRSFLRMTWNVQCDMRKKRQNKKRILNGSGIRSNWNGCEEGKEHKGRRWKGIRSGGLQHFVKETHWCKRAWTAKLKKDELIACVEAGISRLPGCEKMQITGDVARFLQKAKPPSPNITNSDMQILDMQSSQKWWLHSHWSGWQRELCRDNGSARLFY